MPAADDDAAVSAALEKQGPRGGMQVSHLGKIGTKNGFLFLDTCYAGAIRLNTGPTRINQDSDLGFYVSSRVEELAK